MHTPLCYTPADTPSHTVPITVTIMGVLVPSPLLSSLLFDNWQRGKSQLEGIQVTRCRMNRDRTNWVFVEREQWEGETGINLHTNFTNFTDQFQPFEASQMVQVKKDSPYTET